MDNSKQKNVASEVVSAPAFACKQLNLSEKTISIISVAAIILATATTPSLAQDPLKQNKSVSEAKCEVNVQASSEDGVSLNQKSCSSGSILGLGAILNFLNPNNGEAASPTKGIPGSHVAVSGSVALNTTVSVPGGTPLTIGDNLSVGHSIHSDLSTAPQISSGFGVGSGVASAGSVGNGSGQGNGSGSGDSFGETAGSSAGASSTASDLGAGSGFGGGVGVSGSLD